MALVACLAFMGKWMEAVELEGYPFRDDIQRMSFQVLFVVFKCCIFVLVSPAMSYHLPLKSQCLFQGVRHLP